MIKKIEECDIVVNSDGMEIEKYDSDGRTYKFVLHTPRNETFPHKKTSETNIVQNM